MFDVDVCLRSRNEEVTACLHGINFFFSACVSIVLRDRVPKRDVWDLTVKVFIAPCFISNTMM